MQANARTERSMRIEHGNATVVYCSAREGWVLPGGKVTTNRDHAERTAAHLDRLTKRRKK